MLIVIVVVCWASCGLLEHRSSFHENLTWRRRRKKKTHKFRNFSPVKNRLVFFLFRLRHLFNEILNFSRFILSEENRRKKKEYLEGRTRSGICEAVEMQVLEMLSGGISIHTPESCCDFSMNYCFSPPMLKFRGLATEQGDDSSPLTLDDFNSSKLIYSHLSSLELHTRKRKRKSPKVVLPHSPL